MERAKRDIDISLGNIEGLLDEKNALEIRSSAHIREIARGVLRFLPKELSFESGDEFRNNYAALCQRLEPSQRVEFCRFLIKEANMAGGKLIKKLFDIKKSPSNARVVYVKNALSDIAFEKFSGEFEKVAVYYAPDFESALEDVYYSKADYAILPISSSVGGRMLRFSELMLRYEMKAVLSCTVHSNADESENTFLLLSKNFELIGTEQAEEDRFFEFVLSEPGEVFVPLLSAAQSYSCKYHSVHSFGNPGEVTVCLEVKGAELDAFCLYLFLEAPRHLPLGVYKHI